MNVVVFGASGVVGHGVLRACLLDPGVTRVVMVNRRPLGITHPLYSPDINRLGA